MSNFVPRQRSPAFYNALIVLVIPWEIDVSTTGVTEVRDLDTFKAFLPFFFFVLFHSAQF